MSDLVLYDCDGEGIVTLTLNRPELRNPISDQEMVDALLAALERLETDDAARVAILTGAGKGFSSGGNIQEMKPGGTLNKGSAVKTRAGYKRGIQRLPLAFAALEVPVIAAVNGAAIGWGMELALYADIRIASQKATFSEMFIKRGLVCDVGGFYRLPAVVGPAKAAELLFTGDIIDAAEALRINLVSEVAPHEALLDRANALAARIAANPPLALRYMKQGLRRAAYGDAKELGAWAIETIRALMKTEDHTEGVASFLEKRAPNFSGR